MTTPRRHHPTNAELLALIEGLQQQHRAEIQALTATMRHQQTEISALKGQTSGTSSVGVPSASTKTRLSSMIRMPFGGRGTRIGVGLSLALVLLVAPGGSAVTHAGTEGLVNTAYGTGALYGNTGTFSSAFGVNALHSSSSGDHNTASGGRALYSNTTGAENTASGYSALYANTSGGYNTASGTYALSFNTTGNYNTASGQRALSSNSTGSFNTATGYTALSNNTTGEGNTAFGVSVLYNNTTGVDNTISGSSAMYSNTIGHDNTASGFAALDSNSTGSYNTALGNYSGTTTNAANGNTTGSYNTFIGYNSGPGSPTQLTNATAIGANAVVSQSNSIVLGGTGDNTQRIGVGTTTPHSALQIARGYLQYRSIVGAPPANACSTDADSGRTVVRTDGPTNLYVCLGTAGWVGK